MNYVRPEIATMAGYVPGEQPQAGKFIKLNTNENPYPPSPKVVRAIQRATESGLVRYPDPMGDAFRIRAAEVLGVSPEWILCGNGSDDILTIVTRALVGSGQSLRIPDPSYILYRTLARLQGAKCQEIRFTSDWSLPDSFAKADQNVRLAIVPNPNSPTGTVVPRARLLEIAERLDCPLMIDEAYVDFASEDCMALVSKNEKIMISRTLSKSYALAGLRFGFLVAQPDLIQQFAKVKDSYNCDALSIAGATAAIDDQDWLQDNRMRVIQTRERMFVELEQLGFSVQPSQANFVWCTHSEKPAQPIHEELKSRRILVRYMNYPRWQDGLRISVGTDEQIDALLAVLKQIV